MWFRNRKVGTRILFGFSTMILIMFAVGAVGYWSLISIQKRLENLTTVVIPMLRMVLETDRDLHQMLVAERSLIFANSKSDLFQELAEDYEKSLASSGERWKKYRKIAAGIQDKKLIEGLVHLIITEMAYPIQAGIRG